VTSEKSSNIYYRGQQEARRVIRGNCSPLATPEGQLPVSVGQLPGNNDKEE